LPNDIAKFSKIVYTTTMTQIDCKTCGKKYTPACDYRQGHCPHHPAMINLSVVKTRFTNLINFFKGNK
jgi:hypothetical protein